jgi:hypothetical protein
MPPPGSILKKEDFVMRTRIALLVACLCLGMALLSPSSADFKVWLSPLNATTAATGVSIESGSPSTTIRVTSSSTGFKYIEIPLQLPTYVEIDSFYLCYELADESSYIATVRFTRTTTPDAAWVDYDYTPDLTDPGPVCVAGNTPAIDIHATMTLGLRFYFASTDHWIDIGGINLTLATPSAAIGDDSDSREHSIFHLGQNSPNPFGPATVIKYALDHAADVELDIYDVTGRTVRTLFQGEQPGGEHRAIWDGRDDLGNELASGRYYYRVQVGDQVSSRGMVLLK